MSETFNSILDYLLSIVDFFVLLPSALPVFGYVLMPFFVGIGGFAVYHIIKMIISAVHS